MNRTKVAGTGGNPMRSAYQQHFATPHHPHFQYQQAAGQQGHLAAPTYNQPILRRASAHSILEPHRTLPPRPTPQSTLSYPPSIHANPHNIQSQPQLLQPIAPMPANQQQQLPYIQIDDSPTLSGQKRQLAPPPSQPLQQQTPAAPPYSTSDYYNYRGGNIHDRGGNIHHSLANLSIQPNSNGGAGPARKRARSRTSIDMLASAAEYVKNESK